MNKWHTENDYIKNYTRIYDVEGKRIANIKSFLQAQNVVYAHNKCFEEKQTPKKPYDIDEDYGNFTCSNCDTVIGWSTEKEDHSYCMNCGQKLDWK